MENSALYKKKTDASGPQFRQCLTSPLSRSTPVDACLKINCSEITDPAATSYIHESGQPLYLPSVVAIQVPCLHQVISPFYFTFFFTGFEFGFNLFFFFLSLLLEFNLMFLC